MSTVKTLEEALEVADEARELGYLNRHPTACVVLAEEVRRLQQENRELNRRAQDLAKTPTYPA